MKYLTEIITGLKWYQKNKDKPHEREMGGN